MLNEKVVPPALVIARLLLFCYSERGAEREGRRKEGREMMERNDGDRKRMGRDRQTDRQGQRWRERVRDGGGWMDNGGSLFGSEIAIGGTNLARFLVVLLPYPSSTEECGGRGGGVSIGDIQ